MYTYLRPDRRALPTRRSIHRRGSVALYHSLDIGRLIAFVGSGASAAYGRPSWSELAIILLRATAAAVGAFDEKAQNARKQVEDSDDAPALNESIVTGQASLRDLLIEMRLILGRPLTDDEEPTLASLVRDFENLRVKHLRGINITNLLALCEHVVAVAERPDALRKAVHWAFRPNGQAMARLTVEGLAPYLINTTKAETSVATTDELKEALSTIMGDSISKRALNRHVEQLHVNRSEKDAYYALALRQISREDPAGDREVNETPPRLQLIDPLHDMRDTLGIKRFLTINYDSEINEFLDQRMGYRKLEDDDDQVALRRMRDGFGGMAEVSDARPDQLGRLVAFATLGNPRNVRVLHLHGIYSDPDSLILTEADYQRRYLGQPGRRKAFHEALEALFTGNSILFVGVGMNEADLLQPLRQFASVAREHQRLEEPRFGRAFALLPFENAGKSSARALELEQAYGVYARFYGEPLLPALLAVVDAIETMLEIPPPRKGAKLHDDISKAFEALAKALMKADSTKHHIVMQLMEDIASRSPCENLRDALLGSADILVIEGDALATAIGREVQVARDLVEIVRSGVLYHKKIKPARREACHALLRVYLTRWRSDINSRAMRTALRHLEDARHKWSTEWRTMPTPRQAIFRNVTPHDPVPHPRRDGDCLGAPVWSRHTPSHLSTDSTMEMTSILKSPLFDAVRRIKEKMQEPNGRRIRRMVMPRGSGKGTVVAGVLHELMKKPEVPETDTFSEEQKNDEARRVRSSLFSDNSESTVHYEGAFIAPGSFSTEFGTVAAAFYRFLRVALLHSHDIDRLNGERRKVTYTRRLGDERKGDSEPLGYDYREENDEEPMLGAAERLSLVREAMLSLRDRNQGSDGTSKDKRWLVVIVGVDRMCENGKPVSSAIKNFFELLTHKDFATLPFDIMVISGDAANPIEGLSEREGDGEDSPLKPWPEVCLPITKRFEARPWRDIDQRQAAMPNWTTMVCENDDIGLFLPEAAGDTMLPGLAETLGRSRILDLWVWTMLCDIQKLSQTRDEPLLFDKNEQRRLLQRLNDAALGGTDARVIDIVLSTRSRIERNNAGPGREWADLKEALLKYLALITTPIERQVLLDIVGIRERIDNVLVAASGGTMPQKLATNSPAMIWLQSRLNAEEPLAKPARPKVDRFQLWRRNALSQCLQELSRAGLVFEVMARNPLLPDPTADKRYTVHSVLREHLTDKAEIPLRDLAQRNLYDVSVHDVLPRDLPTLGAKAFDEITALVRELTDRSARDLSPWIRLLCARTARSAFMAQDKHIIEKFDPESFHAIGRRLKAVFSILHGVLSIGAVARLDQRPPQEGMTIPPFDVYRAIIRGLLNASSALSMVRDYAIHSMRLGGRNLFSDPLASLGVPISEKALDQTIRDIAQTREPLHLSEIVWLINERGLVSFVQGRLYDARVLFELASTHVKPRVVDDSDLKDDVWSEGLNPTARRIRLNRALALLDAGKIDTARDEFTLLDEEDRESGHLARAYLGVCAHLEGRFDTATRHYEEAIKYFESQNNLRAVSTFNRHLADLLRRDKKFDEAMKRVDRARVAAARQEHRDLMNMALISHARLLRAEGGRSAVHRAASMLRQAESYAKSMGAHRIAADALRGLSDLMLDDGETDFAGLLAVEAMAISSINGMKLRKISSAMIYARVLIARGQPVYAQPILRQALDEAERCGYQLRASRAADLLYEVEATLSSTRTLEDRPPLG